MSYSLTLTDARNIVRYFGHNARSTAMYPNTMIDLAIQTTTDRVVREAFLLYTTGTMTLNSGTATLGALPTGCRPDRLIKAYLVGANVQVGWGYDGDTPWTWPWTYGVLGGPWPNFGGWPQQSELTIGDYSQLLNGQYSVNQSSQPTIVAFDSRSGSGAVYPTPQQNYTLTMGWTALFTQWPAGQPVLLANVNNLGSVATISIIQNADVGRYTTAPTLTIAMPNGTGLQATATIAITGTTTLTGQIGTITVTSGGSGYFASAPPTVYLNGADATNITFNLEDDYLQDILMNGVPPQMQYTEQEHKYLPPGWADKYIDSVVARLRGKGNLGVQSIAVEPRG